MSYSGISVKEAISNINNGNNGWFLPAIQRPYVWGARHENEKYICKLFDSILRGYPIGGLIIWNTDEIIPYREFVTDYCAGDNPKLVDSGLHCRKDKWLIYDGQQRLQTLYSCLKYTFNNRVLVFDMLFDLNDAHEANETGFSFVEKNSTLIASKLRMNELFSKLSDEKTSFRKDIIKRSTELSESQEAIIEKNIDQLWNIFVATDKSSLAYFPIKSTSEEEVNEIFERLNSGGMALSLSDLLFSNIKGNNGNYDFEEKLQLTSKEIYNKTGKGYFFGAYNILQVINLLVKGRVRVDPKDVKDSELNSFVQVWSSLEAPLRDFFVDYIFGHFGINHISIIPRNISLLPLIVYFYEIYNKGFKFKDISSENLIKLDKYFIKSQINDWSLQSYVDNFSKIILSKSVESGNNIFDFPIHEIEEKINEKKQRNIGVLVETFANYGWFSLKVLTPSRIYQFEPDSGGRFNPEIDHIYPIKIEGHDAEYRNNVDILWNMQPTKGDINGYKTNHHPKFFFTDKLKNSKGELIHGSKYVSSYDFLHPKNEHNQIDFSDPVWDNPFEFIAERKKLMINYLKLQYDIELI